MGFVSIKDISFSYDTNQTIIKNISWDIPKGEFHTLIGRSGCGKTTFLKIVAGLVSPTSGRISIDGTTVLTPSHRTGFVFQTPTLLEWLSVIDNVLLPLTISNKKKPEYVDLGLDILASMGLKKHTHKYPNELSGGQQSRVSIARALITEPSLLLMDEPFASLDAMTRQDLQIDLLRLCVKRKTTVLFITHDISEAVYLSDKIALMNSGEIQQNFPIKIDKPRKNEIRYSASFNNLCSDIHDCLKVYHGQTEEAKSK